jgi:hypothetical protein
MDVCLHFFCLYCPVQKATLWQGWSSIQDVVSTVCEIYSHALILTGNRPEALILGAKDNDEDMVAIPLTDQACKVFHAIREQFRNS